MKDKPATPPSTLFQRLAKIKLFGASQSTGLQPMSLEQTRQLRQSVDIVNQLLNENAHRPDATRLLRDILRERAELNKIQTRDENSLSG